MTAPPKTVPAPLCGEISLPGDKSITHRAALFSALADGESHVRTTLLGRDNFASLRVLRQLGVDVRLTVAQSLAEIATQEGFSDAAVSTDGVSRFAINGCGVGGFSAPTSSLFCGNSGTTARLLCGMLAGCSFRAQLTGDASLSRRPFKRVSDPLGEMGARFSADMLPLEIEGGGLHGIAYDSPRASAQVKSAVLIAGLCTSGPVSVTEPRCSRDHTERMFSAMGCAVREEELDDGRWKVSLPEDPAQRKLSALEISVPGDFSAAAFFIVAAAVVPGSRVVLRDVGFNSTRTGLFSVLERMGAQIEVENQRTAGGEDVVDLTVTYAPLQGVEVDAHDTVRAIDEIPVLSVAAACASGTTRIHGAGELRVKESDRLAKTRAVLETFGVNVEEHPDGLTIEGNPELFGASQAPGLRAQWEHSDDHRIAMSAAVLEYAASGLVNVADISAVETSFPGFVDLFESLCECQE